VARVKAKMFRDWQRFKQSSFCLVEPHADLSLAIGTTLKIKNIGGR